ncbi:peptidase S8 [Allostreptomyces psammosilenae]|uniref:Subtilisin family serine protease n=1 Tax=Allostreptomyces psammosilenae TaxID=1892865 RepID=A0A852ZPS5_9ACTN|nr:peptidase S8 [Allostreptomyces psammosilenae]NYI04393.1 subtilisin family serine protease [Allostreptomyces psammosilenae]
MSSDSTPSRYAYRRGGQGPPADRPTVFAPGEDNTVPGEVLVEMTPEAARGVSAAVPLTPTRGAAATVDRLGVAPLDEVLGEIGIRSVVRLDSPAPPTPRGLKAFVEPAAVGASYRLRFEEDLDVHAVADRLSALDEVAVAEPNRWREALVVPDDPEFARQWGLVKLNCPDAWEVTTGHPRVVVAVIDTGVDLDHPELAPLLTQGQDLVDLGPQPVVEPGWVVEGDYLGVDADPQDEVGHGTHVAGTIACRSNEGSGVAGVTWNCTLMPVRVLARLRRLSDGRVSGSGSAADIAAGIRWAVDHGARVLNLSLGGYVDTSVERNAIAYATGRGAVVVAAMGNDGADTPNYPAAYPGVVAVGALTETDARAGFSNTGPHIDLAAPGVKVLSTHWDNTHASKSGTSMAAPHVAGVAALLMSANPGLPADEVGDILRSTARPLRDDPADPVPNDAYGYGLVDARAALGRARPTGPARRPVTTAVLGAAARGVPSGVCTRPQLDPLCEPGLSHATCPRDVDPYLSQVCTRVEWLCPPGATGGVCPRDVDPWYSQVCSAPDWPDAACLPVSEEACPKEGDPCGRRRHPGGPRGGRGAWRAYDPYGYDPYGRRYGC